MASTRDSISIFSPKRINANSLGIAISEALQGQDVGIIFAYTEDNLLKEVILEREPSVIVDLKAVERVVVNYALEPDEKDDFERAEEAIAARLSLEERIVELETRIALLEGDKG